ncbi:MAG: polyphosphate polymerase domain-containing protein [Myxococcota bacterium]|nr:polyphosphate polymerase domain-containing protein [Myxococcota bacterium]
MLTTTLLEAIPFPEASTKLVRERALLQRVDTKFVLGLPRLEAILSLMSDHFGLVRAANQPIAEYRTIYFDTRDHRCLTDHHRGRRPRFKIRIRHYPDREVSFLEVKRKTSANITIKHRRPIPYRQEHLQPEDQAFIDANSSIVASSLRPSLRTNFARISLVGLHTMERATFDVNLCFDEQENTLDLPRLVIAEIKQARFMPRSPAMMALRSVGIRPLSVSKYCTAAMLRLPSVTMNRYRPKLRSMRRACHD